jgi:threonine 3-dehydrogenase
MDLLTVLTILASLATIAGLLYIILIGQRSISEWLREKRAGTATERKLTIPEPGKTLAEDAVGEQMVAAIKTTPSSGLDLMTKSVPSIHSGEILVRVSAASICGTDLSIYDWNQWAESRVHPPVVLGHEFCGVVVDRGEEVTDVGIGDFIAAESHVVCGKCSYCQSGHPNVCPNTQTIGIDRDGAFAEYISIPAANAWKLPADVPVEIAVCMEPFGNAVHAAFSQDLAARNVLITGCGPIGLMTIALAKWAGASIICASDVSAFRLSLASRMGADVLLNARSPNRDLERLIMEATGGQGVDVFLEMSGAPPALTLGLAALRNAGRAVLMGLSDEPIQVNISNLITLKGITVYGAVGRLSDRTWERMRNVLASGGIDLSPMITHEFPLDQLDKAFGLVQSRETGKVILRAPHGAVLTKPIHFVALPSSQPTPNVSWHDAYLQQAQEIIADSRSRELLLLKSELDNLFTAAQELQQTIYGFRRQLLDPKLTEAEKSQVSEQLAQMEVEQEHILQKSREVRRQIEAGAGKPGKYSQVAM